MESSGREMEILLEADKIRMMDRLAMQSKQFELVIENLGKQVAAAKLLDDYTDREKIVEKMNALMDNIGKPCAPLTDCRSLILWLLG